MIQLVLKLKLAPMLFGYDVGGMDGCLMAFKNPEVWNTIRD